MYWAAKNLVQNFNRWDMSEVQKFLQKFDGCDISGVLKVAPKF